MADRPTLYLSNWSSHRTPGAHGPGRKWTIMARPRAWEHGEGRVTVLLPPAAEIPRLVRLVNERRGGAWPSSRTLDADGLRLASELPEYRAACEAHWRAYHEMLPPGALMAKAGCLLVPVADGDTLCCACSVAEARAGRCHRSWSAPHLYRAGWRVVLEGVEFVEVDHA